MCLNPRVIKNPSKHVSPEGGKVYITVKCGKCAECRKEHELEWQHRAYNVYDITKDKGGFTFFETLTYSEDCVPRFYGMRCFDPEHIQAFRDLLRSKIRNYVKKDIFGRSWYPFRDQYKTNFKVFITSEYGGLTHRPHYHCLFHCSIKGLSVHLLRYFIKQSWPHGYVDRVDTINSRIVNSQGVCAYVSKYIGKDDEFSHEIENKMAEDRKNLSRKQFQSIYTPEVVKKIFPFHRQSQGYGAEILETHSRRELFNTGQIHMPDKDNVESRIPIPMYIQRKLFYDCVLDLDNLDESGKPKKRWVINDYGIEFKMKHLDNVIDQFASTTLSKIQNISNIESEHNSHYNIYNDILTLLNGRSLHDYSIYKLVYKDKLAIFNNLSDELFYYLTLDMSRKAPFSNEYPLVEHVRQGHSILIDDTFLPEFFGFDSIDKLLRQAYKDYNEHKNNNYLEIRKMRNQLKLIKESHLLRKLYKNTNVLPLTPKIYAIANS